MAKPNFDAARRYIINRMTDELPGRLHYHGIHHTLDDVYPAAVRLAEMEGVNEEDMLLLKTAVLFHDSGYIYQYYQNEPIGAQIAAENLPRYGYSASQVVAIIGMIMATQLPQTPLTHLEQIIADADLDSLGREDYFIVHHRLQLELTEHNMPTTLYEWYMRQLEFLEGHTYFTESAQNLRAEAKEKHLAQIREVCGM